MSTLWKTALAVSVDSVRPEYHLWCGTNHERSTLRARRHCFHDLQPQLRRSKREPFGLWFLAGIRRLLRRRVPWPVREDRRAARRQSLHQREHRHPRHLRLGHRNRHDRRRCLPFDLQEDQKTDTISSSFDTVAVTLLRTISLPLTGGSTAVCSMAANAGYLFIGTDQSPQGVEVKKSTGVVTVLGGFSPPINVTSITADQYGYVTVTQGSFGGGENGFSVFGPTGGGEADGGGADFMVGTTNAVSTTTLPTSDHFPLERLVVRPRASANPTQQ
jgi:hypothetical protein